MALFRWHQRWRPLAALIFALACPVAAQQQWLEISSPNFSVVTDSGEKSGRDIALRFEQSRAVFGALFGREKVNTAVPLQIVVFRDHKEFRQFAPLWEGKPAKLAAYFQAGADVNFVVLNADADAADWNAVFHEYAHALLDSNFHTQLWFEEGFAEFFSTMQVYDDFAEIGHAAPGRLQRLLNTRPMPLTEMMAVKKEWAVYHADSQRRDLFYAQSWLMVHYLFDAKKLDDATAYFRLAEQGVPIYEAIQRGFQMSAEQLQRSVNDYLRSNQALLYRVRLPAALAKMPITSRPMEQADSLAVLAELHQHLRGYHDQSMKEFQAALRLNPDNAVANRGLGYAYLRDNDFQNAAECFRRAAAQNDKDPRVHYYAALLLNRASMMTNKGPQDPAAMRKELETAVTLDPQYADAWNLLAYVDTVEGESEKAIEHMKRAVELSPQNELYAANLSLYLMNANQWDEAEPILKRLLHSDNKDLAASARINLAQVAAERRPRKPLEETRRAPLKEEPPAPEPPKPEPKPELRPIRYLRGTLVSVDCTNPPAAVLTVVSGGTTWKMRASDTRKLLLIRVDAFSCDWKNRNVLVNYRVSGPGKADLLTLELQ